jgi:hypothetical protein
MPPAEQPAAPAPTPRKRAKKASPPVEEAAPAPKKAPAKRRAAKKVG